MVHGLAQPLGGGIRIFSKLGLGTNVELWLPEAAGSPLQPLTIRRGGPSSPIHRGKTLLVDDEEVVRIHTAHMLDEIGFEVIEASSAEAALAALDNLSDLTLLVTDHLMPGMDGVELSKRVQALRPTLPCLIISGYADVERVAPDLQRLNKPFKVEVLQRMLAEMNLATQ
ncbi:response regulator [Rhizobium rhizoryzae]|uniref:CheY-like chemotaxis protein n=1 Tax=Rhizobium rhizoryzae TaxID=451876 RepID=A0A7W6PUN7_9HYPH|nr:response regulator [Rhizobium rhizoryzae]MBB4146070.1 CheY-like chemotaxis protein [Rhizobium rhizoryzae]